MRLLALFFCVVWMSFAPSPANAFTSDVAKCTAQTSITTSYEQIVKGAVSKNCGNNRWSIKGPRVWLFFDKTMIKDRQSQLHLRTDLNRFTAVTIYARNQAGDVTSRHWDAEDAVKNWRTGSLMDLQLPAVEGEIVEVSVAIDHPWMNSMLTKAVLTDDVGNSSQSINMLFIICIFIGIALTPLIYNLSFYRALQKPFLLCHQGMTFFCLAYTGLASSLVYHFLSNPPPFLLSVLTPFAFSAAVSFAALFAANFIEEENLSPRIRKMLKLAPFWIMTMMVITNIPSEFTRPHANLIYYLSFFPILILFVTALVQALSRNSRAARFQLAAWTPILLVSCERMGRGLALYTAPHWFDHLLYAALAIEIIITSLGVADRFVIMKRQRDVARVRARILEGLADSDPLTGLLNRRGIEGEFNAEKSNITAVAILDLDYFKDVNDQHGHDIGDKVLVAVSEALSSTKTTTAGRIGGEEFILLIRADNALQEAEQLRRAISLQVAHQVGGLQKPVTASCGLLHLGKNLKTNSFEQIHSGADKLLYQAKQSGRNKTICNDAPVRQLQLSRPGKRKTVA